MLLLDTCVLIFDALAPARLGRAAAAALDRGEEEGALACSDISLWEIAMLVERGRFLPGTGAKEFIELALSSRGTAVLRITAGIAARSASIPLHGDPADRIIAASAIEHNAVLVTPDKQLRKLAGLKTIW
jgi:PIN domain nuclease of toxin-antitoxin system